MNNLPNDIVPEVFGEQLLSILKTYGFGVLAKSDLEAALLHAIACASESYSHADSFARAEMLRITDQKYRAMSRRAGMWLDKEDLHQTDEVLFQEFLFQAIKAYWQCPDEKEIRIVIDDEIKRRNMQRALERAAIKGLSIALDISLTGRCLVFRGTDLDRMIDRVTASDKVDPELKQVINEKHGIDRRKTALNFLKNTGAKLFVAIVDAAIKQSNGG
jgi:hypothetical protein